VLIGKWWISFSSDFHHRPNPVDGSSTPPPSQRSFVIGVGQLYLSLEREKYATRPLPHRDPFRTAGGGSEVAPFILSMSRLRLT